MGAGADTRGGWPILRLLLTRPYLLTGIAVGIVVYVVAGAWFARGVTRALIGWDAGVIVFLLSIFFLYMPRSDLARMKQKAIEHDEAGRFILLLTLIAAIASVGALIAELALARAEPASSFASRFPPAPWCFRGCLCRSYSRCTTHTSIISRRRTGS